MTNASSGTHFYHHAQPLPTYCRAGLETVKEPYALLGPRSSYFAGRLQHLFDLIAQFCHFNVFEHMIQALASEPDGIAETVSDHFHAAYDTV